MKDLAVNGDKRMTVKEVADVLGYEGDTIRKKVKELFPEIVENGKITLLNELQVTAIRQSLVPRTLALKSEVDSALTELDMMILDEKVSQWKSRRIAELSKQVDLQKMEIKELKPKAECADALMRSDKTMSITDCAKHFGLHPKTQVFPYLRDRGYLTLANLPSQSAIDAGYLELKETKCADNEVRPQSVVPIASLDIWRTRVVPQIKKWEAE